MRGACDFDIAQCVCGAATSAVRQILTEWAAIDWFVAPRDGAVAAPMAKLHFADHNTRARRHLPDYFSESLAVQSVGGNWNHFATFCDRARTQENWDWKYGALKKLSSDHSKARGWTLQDQAQHAVPLDGSTPPRPGALFYRFGDHVLWTSFGPKLDLGATLSRDDAANAGWYVGYAAADLTECLEWQLAESSSDLEGNPFVPLLHCYAAGFYPFSFGREHVVLFAFNS